MVRVDGRTRTPTGIERPEHGERIGHHAPWLGDGETFIVSETDSATPTVRTHQPVFLAEATDPCLCLALARVGPFDNDDPTMTERLLGNNFKVVPQLAGDRLVPLQVALELGLEASGVHIVSDTTPSTGD